MQSTLFADLPEFEGRDPIATALSLSGNVDRRTRPFRIGERIALVVEVTVTGVTHKETKGGIVRSHQLAVADAYELGGDRKEDLLEVLHAEHQAFEDELKARRPIDFTDPDPYGQDGAAGAGPEARADFAADLAALEEWANSDETLEAWESSDAALAALAAYAQELADDWEAFDPEGQPDHVALQELRTWAQDAVAAGDYGDEDQAIADLVAWLNSPAEPLPA